MTADPAGLRRAALQTARAILALQRQADEEIRELNQELRRRTDALADANAELLRQSELARANARDAELFRIAFHSSASGMALVTPELRLARVNPALCEFLGRVEADVRGASLEALLPADELVPIVRAIARLLRGEQLRVLGEAQFRCAGGRTAWGSLSSAVVRDDDGAPLYLVIEVQDITARKSAEAEHRRLEEQFIQAQKMEALGTLAGGVAHDFNNVLAAIVSNADLLTEIAADRGDVAEVSRDIGEAAARGADLVRQILTFSRRGEARRKSVYVGQIVRQSVRMLRSGLPAAIELRTELPENDPVVEADPTQLHQIVTNLATNGWHAMESGEGALTIRVAVVDIDAATALGVPNLHSGTYVRIVVEDTGVGMDVETMRHIFEPFFTTKPPGKGTGLGLSVVYGIVREHGGAIRVTSARGRGTQVEVYLPLAARVAAVESTFEAQAQGGDGERILVVDDEPSLALVITRLLCKLGYAARGVSSPVEAIALCASEVWDLVLVDFNMPVMNGIELIRRLRERGPWFPVVMMSGYTAPVSAEDLVRLGVWGVLEKPVTGVKLAEAVRGALATEAAAAV